MDVGRAREQYAKSLRIAPADADLLRRMASRAGARALGCGAGACGRPCASIRAQPAFRGLGETLLRLRHYPEAREALDRGLALSPQNLQSIEFKAMTFLGRETWPAPGRAQGRAEAVEPTALVAYFATY